MKHCCCWLIVVVPWMAALLQAAEEVRIKDPSPDGKFALRAGRTEDDMAIVQKATGKIVQKLEWKGNPSAFEARLVWSADSQRVVHMMPWRRGVDLTVYYRNGGKFEEIKFPEGMPHPELPERRNADGTSVYVKSWSHADVDGWLKSGDLELIFMAESEDDERDEMRVTLTFDKKHVAHVRKEDAPASHYLIVGRNLELDGSHDEAIAAFTRAIERDPKNAEAYVRRGDAKEAKGERDAALADYDLALQADPKNSRGLFGRANARVAKGDLEGAIADETAIIETDPFSGYWAYLERGAIYYAKKEWAKAVGDFRSPIPLKLEDGGHAHILVWLARVKLGERAEADKELASFVGANPDNSDTASVIARYVLGQTTEDEVLKSAAESGAKTYPDCEAWFFIGFKRGLTGDQKAAAEAYGKCLAAAKEKRPPNYWLPPEIRFAAEELKAVVAP